VLTLGITGGEAPARWTLTMQGSSANLSGVSGDLYTFSPTQPGTYTFYLVATDEGGSSSRATATVTVDPALSVALSANPTVTQVGGASLLTLEITGGVAPVRWELSMNGSSACLPVWWSNQYWFAPRGPGVYTFYLNATDRLGNSAEAIATVTVEPALRATLSADPRTTEVGVASVLTLGFSGGVAPIHWTLTRNGSWANLTSVAGDRYTFVPTHAGVYTFFLLARDAVGSRSFSIATVTVEPALRVTLSANPTITQVGRSSKLSLGFTGGVTPVRWTLTMNGSSANLSGVGSDVYTFAPTAAGTYTFYLNATDQVGSSSRATATVTVKSPLQATLSATPTTTQVGEASMLAVGFSGGVAPIAWTLTVNGSSANLSGAGGGVYRFAPTAAGTYTFYLNATDVVGSTSDATATVTVEPSLVATLSANPTTTEVGRTSVLTLGFSGGVAPIAWTLTVNGSWTNLSGVSGETYSFSPTAAGTYTFYLNATDAVGSSSNVTTTVTVEPALMATLSASLTTTQVGEASALSLGLSGGVPPITWTLTMNGSSANLSGVSGGSYTFAPTAPGTYTFYLNATDAVDGSSHVTATVTVVPPLVATLTASPTTTQVGEASVLTLGFSGGVAPITWTLTVNGSSANLSGVGDDLYAFAPTAPGTYTFYLNATDAVGSTSKATAVVTVDPPLAVTLTAGTPTTQVGATSVLTLGFSGGVAPVAWTLTVNGSSTNLSTVTGDAYTFSPTAAGTYTFYLNATDAVGSRSSATAVVTVEPPLMATLGASPTTTEAGAPSVLTLGFSGGVAPIAWTLTMNGSRANLSGVGDDQFTFVPALAGSYTFYLNATDAVGSVSQVAVVVTVEPALAANLTASPTTTQVGGASVLTLGFSGGVAPIAWTLTINGSSTNLSGVSGDTYSFVPTAAGSYTFYLNATDTVGSTSDAMAVVTVNPALSVTLSADPTATQVGATSVLTLGFSGGVAPIAWTLTINGSSTNLSGVSGDTYSFTPAAPGTYTFYLNATDAVGSTSYATATVTTQPGLVATLTASPTPTQVGAPTTLALEFSGGVAPVAWTLTMNGSSTNLSGVSGDRYSFAPRAAGTYTFYLNATDAVRSIANATATVTVEPALRVTLSANPASTEVGGTSVLTLGFSGGVAPVAWTLRMNGSSTNLSGVSGDMFAFVSGHPGTYTFYLNATDAVGSIAQAAATVSVEAGAPTTHPITFTETGVPTGLTWYLNLSNGQKFTSDTTTIGFSELNGSYSYGYGATVMGHRYYSALPGKFTVTGGSVAVNVGFTLTRQVVLKELNLPAGMEWWANFTGGYSFLSTTTTMVLYLPLGTWTFTVQAANPDYQAKGHTFTVRGSLTIAHAPLRFLERFKLETFPTTFTETGLPHGSRWCVAVTGGRTYCSIGTTVTFKEPNGTFDYTLTTTASGYSGAGGSFTVEGAKTFSVTFSTGGGAIPAMVGSERAIDSVGTAERSWNGIALAAVGLLGIAIVVRGARRDGRRT
jgi:large repetitive protein